MTAVGGTREGEPTPLGEPARFEGGLAQVADSTWAWLQPNGGLGESNAGLVVGDGQSLLVDTLWDARLTGRMLETIEPLVEERGAPISTLINTHGDGDHWYGNGLVGPSVEIVATDAANEQMREEPPAMLTRLAPLGPVTGLIAKAPLLPGRERLGGVSGFSSMLGRYDFKNLEPRRPDRPFSGSARLDVGGRRAEAFEVGPAHTVGDAIVWVPDVRVVFAGDILFNGVIPIMWAGPVKNWIAALDLIESLEPETVVGGHGPPAGLGEVGVLRDHWRWLAEEVEKAGDEPASALAERLVRSREWRDAPWGSWSNPERTVVNVARIAATEDGSAPKPLGTVGRIGLIGDMGALAARLSG